MPPARSTALNVSYSQLVPGNTGMTAWGLGDLKVEAAGLVLQAKAGTSLSLWAVRVGYMASSVSPSAFFTVSRDTSQVLSFMLLPPV